MERRSAWRTSAPSVLISPAISLLLAVTVAVVTGPGASASRAPLASPGRVAPAAADTDPVGTLASDLDYDVDSIFRYVADEIRYEPYAGILRGATGTLAARAGNSVDKALLLAALLDDSGVQYRFARGELDAATGAALAASLATDVDGARKIAIDPLTRGLDTVAGPDAPAPTSSPLADADQQQARSAVDAGKVRLDVARSRLSDTVSMISDALDGAGIHLPTASDVALPADELANHTWVQMAYGSGWQDLDPTMAATQPGTVLAPASATLAQLPDDLRYKVEFDVLVERDSGGQLVTDNALTYSGFADQLASTPVTFGHVTPHGLQDLGITLSSLFGGGWLDYRPTLEVGGTSLIADKSVAFPTGDGTDLFGDVASPGAGVVDGEATAEWLEVHVTPPGSEAAVARRTVFDRLPADLRAAGDLSVAAVEPIELIDLKGTGSSDFLPMLGTRTFAIATGPTSVAPVVANIDDPLGMTALAYHNVRDAIDAEMALDEGARTFVDGPNIVSVTVDVEGTAAARSGRVGLDIWYRNHGVLPLAGQSIGVARSQLVAGIADQVAERFEVEGLTGATQAPHQTLGVGDVFDAAAKAGVPIRVLRGTVADSLPYAPGPTKLIQAALASGDVVVVPASPVTIDDSQHVGWWTIDPETGVTADAMDDGAGQEVAEEAVLINGERQAYVCYGAMANWASVAIMAAAELVTTLAESAIFRLYNGGFGGAQCFAV